jgi:hypothetical protein
MVIVGANETALPVPYVESGCPDDVRRVTNEPGW